LPQASLVEGNLGGIKMVDKQKIHQIVEYIKLFEFPFDTLDLNDGLEEILTYFNVSIDLSLEEISIIKRELLPMAESAQTREVVAMQDEFPLFSFISKTDVEEKRVWQKPKFLTSQEKPASP
jgi:hypothetical protein